VELGSRVLPLLMYTVLSGADQKKDSDSVSVHDGISIHNELSTSK
jgi:hypothetical protein